MVQDFRKAKMSAEHSTSTGVVASRRGRQPSLPRVKTCEICGKDWQPATRYQAARNKTCSPECNGALISQKRRGKTTAQRLPCATCGTPVYRPPSHRARNAALYCSGSCRSKTFADRCRAISALGQAAMTPEARERATAHLKGPTNPSWKGGVTYRSRKGNYVNVRYVRCPPDLLPMARTDGYVMEHRLVMARWARMTLTRTECVHHLDHDPLNNSRSNLELWPDNRSHKLAEHGRFVEGAANRWSPMDLVQP